MTTVSPSFAPALIADMEVVFFKEDERGRFYLLHNLENSNYVKIHENTLDVIKLLDGTNTLLSVREKLPDVDVEKDLIPFVKLLVNEGFVKNLKKPKVHKHGDVFSFKVRLITLSSRQMDWLNTYFSFIKKMPFKIFYTIFVIVGLSLFFYNVSPALSYLGVALDPQTSMLPLILDFPLFYFIEFVHELAHAGVYRYYGGSSADVGLEFHFLIPFFYTDTLDARKMKTRENVAIFLAGPLTSLFFAEIFVFLFIFEPTMRVLWASNIFLWHVSTLLTLTPIIRTDGYFIVQAVLKFPNLLQHGITNVKKVLQLAFRRISNEGYEDYMSQYSISEKKILAVYSLILPVGVGLLMTLFFFLAIHSYVIKVFMLTPQVISGLAPNLKTYLLWFFYVEGLVFAVIGALGTGLNIVRQRFSRS
jgi:hypothetical protein